MTKKKKDCMYYVNFVLIDIYGAPTKKKTVLGALGEINKTL